MSKKLLLLAIIFCFSAMSCVNHEKENTPAPGVQVQGSPNPTSTPIVSPLPTPSLSLNTCFKSDCNGLWLLTLKKSDLINISNQLIKGKNFQLSATREEKYVKGGLLLTNILSKIIPNLDNEIHQNERNLDAFKWLYLGYFSEEGDLLEGPKIEDMMTAIVNKSLD